MDNKSDDRYYKIPYALKSKSNTGECIDTDDYNEYDYDGGSDMSSSGDSPRSVSNNNASPSAMPNGTPRVEPSLGESPRTKPRVLQNEIKALPGRKFTGTELTPYGNKIDKKKTGMI